MPKKTLSTLQDSILRNSSTDISGEDAPQTSGISESIVDFYAGFQNVACGDIDFIFVFL